MTGCLGRFRTGSSLRSEVVRPRATSKTRLIRPQRAGRIDARGALPAPAGRFALIIRTYVPREPILTGAYPLPNVERG